MNFPSIDIQGSILSTDLLSKIRSEQASFQSGKDFRPDFTNAKLKDEISFAWQEAKGQWTIYKSKLGRLRSGELGTTETRNFWISPLLTNLGYNLTFNRQAEELNGKPFSIGYRDTTLDGFPIYSGGYHESLDKRSENKQIRMSPHALVQEYLNYSEHLYGIVTNGRQLRLLRDASRITRLSYVEFNLEKMMEEDLYSDFVLFFRLLHASRMPKSVATGPDSIIEKYHQEALEAGSTIRNKLGSAVKKAIQDLANAFINHPNNKELGQAVRTEKLNLDEYYKLQLRIIYRLLFLFVIEERNLVYAESKASETKRFNEIYFKHYSLIRLRRIAKKLAPPESHRHFDLWRSLVSTFSLFEKKEVGKKLGIMSLQGDLFGYNSLVASNYDLHECDVSNAVILRIIKSLTYFENEQGVLIAVNYGGLDVEEFGSVYEGLLELKLVIKQVEGSDLYSCTLDASSERGTSGSHYTPEELVQPLIKHSLDYLIKEKLREKDPAKGLLSLKIADVACGSGHILLSASRRVAHELAIILETRESGAKEKIEQPSPGYVRRAMKEVVRNCIYGVDKNPLAVELCKVALWLEAFNPGEPLNFLDHHIKCGDAIVGLVHRNELEKGIADEAFKTLIEDDKRTAKSWRDRNAKERKEREAKSLQLKADFQKATENSVQETIAEYRAFNSLPESTPDELEQKSKAYSKFIDGKGLTFLKAMADTQLAQFFIPKDEQNAEYLMTDADFRMILSGYNKSWQDRKVAKASVVALKHRFFHWFLEFPEVSRTGGFDCILGNPPFLAGSKVSQSFGHHYLSFLKYYFANSGGQSDFVTYFFRRDADLIDDRGIISLISTNTISEGESRVTCLELLLARGFNIHFAIKSQKWPGLASVDISMLALSKERKDVVSILNHRVVDRISSFLDENQTEREPESLKANMNKSFKGVSVYGDGFVLDENAYRHFLAVDDKNKNAINLYLDGDDLNSIPSQSPSRYVINFRDLTESAAKENYPSLFDHVKATVKPERDKLKSDKGAMENWWLYQRSRPGMYAAIENLNRVLVISKVTRYLNFSFQAPGIIFSDATVVIALNGYAELLLLNSSLHSYWSWKYGSTMGTSRIRYTPTTAFETFPFPEYDKLKTNSNETLGEAYYIHRSRLMQEAHLGLTKIYNLMHDSALDESDTKKNKNIEALKRHLTTNASNHDFNTFKNAVQKLRRLHVEMDTAILKAYQWDDIEPLHGFYQIEHLPDGDNERFTIHPKARKEFLKRLLELNHYRHGEEVKAGVWSKEYSKINTNKKAKLSEPDIQYGSLFQSE